MSGGTILFVSGNFPPVIGGSSVVYEQICRNAADKVIAIGSKLNYEAIEPLGDLNSHDTSCGYTIRRLEYLRPPATKRSDRWLGRFRLFAFDLIVMARILVQLIFLVIRYKAKTVCIGELVYNGWLVFPLRYLCRRRVVLYTHGEELSQDGTHAFAKLRMLFLRHADAVISVSLFCKSFIVSKYGIDPNKVFVISNGIDLDAFTRGQRDRTVFPTTISDKKILLAVSRLVERKGHKQLILAMPSVLSEYPDAHCVIVGEGPLGKSLRLLAEKQGLANRITFMGPVAADVLIRMYRASDVFVLPCQTLPDGDTEGFGLVFLEANACGLPVVAGAAGGTVEAVIDEETGLIVDGTDPAQIAGAVICILGDPLLTQRLTETGWKYAQQCGWGRIADEFLRVCQVQSQRPKRSISFSSETMTYAAISNLAGRDEVGPRLLMTIDVEEEFDWSKFSRSEHRVRGIEGLMAFHEDCRSIKVIPTYVLTQTIMEDQNFSQFFSYVLAEGSAEIGVHLHPWVTRPFWELVNDFNSYQCNLPMHVERRKLETLCRKYEDVFGRRVTIYRAGRWGGAERTSTLLEEMGIEIDLSPSTGYSSATSGGPDFSNLDGRPFWSGPHQNVLTIPASAINYLPGPDWMSRAYFASMETIPLIRSFLHRKATAKRFAFLPRGDRSIS